MGTLPLVSLALSCVSSVPVESNPQLELAGCCCLNGIPKLCAFQDILDSREIRFVGDVVYFCNELEPCIGKSEILREPEIQPHLVKAFPGVPVIIHIIVDDSVKIGIACIHGIPGKSRSVVEYTTGLKTQRQIHCPGSGKLVPRIISHPSVSSLPTIRIIGPGSLIARTSIGITHGLGKRVGNIQ